MSFKKGEQWWLMEAADIIQKLNEPVQEKITDKRCVYYFKDLSN